MSEIRNTTPPTDDGRFRAALCAALAEVPGYGDVQPAELRPLAVKGLAHDHLALAGRDVLLRVPKQSQFALAAAENLSYQAACFQRVAASRRSPRLHAVLPPSAALPMGALLVEHIQGRPPRLPEDLPALAECMARVHALPLPASRAPLEDHIDAVAGVMLEIESQATHMDVAQLDIASRGEIIDELAWARDFAAQTAAKARRQPQTLVLTDTHPGNFLIDASGHAIIVDLEKALYGSPGIDLAHATVYSSTTWDPDVWAELQITEVAAFYRHYLQFAGASGGGELANTLRPWLLPMRRLLFLRAITWCVKWQVLQSRARVAAKHLAASTEDWSAENSDPALIAHVAERVATYLSPAILKRMRGEWRGDGSLAAFL